MTNWLADARRYSPYDREEIYTPLLEASSCQNQLTKNSKPVFLELEKQVETKKRSGAMEFRVSEKGGVSVYGLGRFPVTLYYEQWNRLLAAADELKVFLEENKFQAQTEKSSRIGGR